ncbi:MAG: FtsX-like permease family protein [Sulfuricella sp.]|nr:FtsX-like permease family protein [Sulfuricella sp.]
MAIISTLAVDFRLALRNILRQRRRSVIAIAAISFGVVAMMLAAGYIEWIFWANRELATGQQFGHIQVSKRGYQEAGQADPLAFIMPQDSQALSALLHTPGVQSVAPRLVFSGLISHGDSTMSFLGMGIDPVLDPLSHNLIIVKGKPLSPGEPNAILLGAGLAANLGVKAGDTVVLLTNTPGGGVNAVETHVAGLASSSLKAMDDVMVRVPIAMARKLLRVNGSHVWVVSLKHTELTDSVLASLRKEPSLKPFEMVPWTRLADFYNKTVALFSRQMGVVKLIIAVIIVLSISNTMTMSVMERTVEIGTAMALGVRRKRILRLFLLEGMQLGVIGGVLGTSLGYLAAKAITAVGIPIPAGPGFSHDFIAMIIITPGIVVEALLLAVVTTLIASIYPAWRASRLVIVDALRHNH